MPFSLRGRQNSHPEQDLLVIRATEEKRRLELASERFRAGQQTMSESLVRLLDNKQAQHLTFGGIRRLALHRTPIDLGGVLIEEDETHARINFDIAADGTRLEIATRAPHDSGHFRFVESPYGMVLESNETRLSLTSPLAQEGLSRLENLCENLGSFCLARAS
jgi:hypothetical protein